MTKRRDDTAPGGGSVSIGTIRLRVNGMRPPAATSFAREVANRLAVDASRDGWRSASAVSASVPAAGEGSLGSRTAGAISAVLTRGKGG